MPRSGFIPLFTPPWPVSTNNLSYRIHKPMGVLERTEGVPIFTDTYGDSRLTFSLEFKLKEEDMGTFMDYYTGNLKWGELQTSFKLPYLEDNQGDFKWLPVAPVGPPPEISKIGKLFHVTVDMLLDNDAVLMDSEADYFALKAGLAVINNPQDVLPAMDNFITTGMNPLEV